MLEGGAWASVSYKSSPGFQHVVGGEDSCFRFKLHCRVLGLAQDAPAFSFGKHLLAVRAYRKPLLCFLTRSTAVLGVPSKLTS